MNSSIDRGSIVSFAVFGGFLVFFYYLGLFYTGVLFAGIGLFFLVTLVINAITAQAGEMLNGMVFMAPLMFLIIGCVLLLINLIFI